MWAPLFLFEIWKPASTKEAIAASDRDETLREFQLAFFLRDPVDGSSRVPIELPTQRQSVATGPGNRTTTMWFTPNEERRLSSIQCRVDDVHARAAFVRCYDSLNRLLSFWAVIYGVGFSVARVKVGDIKHRALWEIDSLSVAPEPLVLPAGIEQTGERPAVIALYREARSCVSPFYRLLCCFKVLEAWRRSTSVFAETDRTVQALGLDLHRPRRRITREMLALALIGPLGEQFEGASFKRFFDLVRPWRTKVAHFVADAAPFLNLDDYATCAEIAAVANLTDIVARQVLLDEFEMWRRIHESGAGSAESAPPSASE